MTFYTIVDKRVRYNPLRHPIKLKIHNIDFRAIIEFREFLTTLPYILAYKPTRL